MKEQIIKLLIFIPKAFGIEGARYHAIQSRGSGGTNFSPKLYESGWKGGSRGQIKTYDTSGIAKGFKIGGYGLGVFNAASIQSQDNSGQISGFQATLEQGSNAYSTFGGIYGAAWGVGWEAGRAVTTIPAYQQWKQDTWLPFRQDVFGY